MSKTIRRQHLMANLAAERAGLLVALLGLDESTLVGKSIFDDWTVKDMLAHIAAWDRWEERTMRAILDDEEPDFTAAQDFAVANAVFVADQRTSSLDEVLAELLAARSDWVAWLETVPDEEFFWRRSIAGHAWTFSEVPLQIQWQHDAEHAAQILAWKQTEVSGDLGCKSVTVAALVAARTELLASAKLVPYDERISRPVCEHWTLKDVLGHVADWEFYGAAGVAQMAAGILPDPEPIGSIETWNQAHAHARRDQPWDVIWDDLFAARHRLLASLEEMNEALAARHFAFPWGEDGTAFEWAGIFVAHDREHAHGLRE